jgi:hypothetical protein
MQLVAGGVDTSTTSISHVATTGGTSWHTVVDPALICTICHAGGVSFHAVDGDELCAAVAAVLELGVLQRCSYRN